MSANHNLEIKARCSNLSAARERAARIATDHLGIDHQVDTYFQTRKGRLKLRESSLSGGQLVPYLRPDVNGPRWSRYRVIPVDDPASLKALLTEILGPHRVVEKDREIFLYENVRIHLDRVVNLGTFLELEAVSESGDEADPAQQEKVAYLMKELGIESRDLLATSYEELVDAALGDEA